MCRASDIDDNSGPSALKIAKFVIDGKRIRARRIDAVNRVMNQTRIGKQVEWTVVRRPKQNKFIKRPASLVEGAIRYVSEHSLDALVQQPLIIAFKSNDRVHGAPVLGRTGKADAAWGYCSRFGIYYVRGIFEAVPDVCHRVFKHCAELTLIERRIITGPGRNLGNVCAGVASNPVGPAGDKSVDRGVV